MAFSRLAIGTVQFGLPYGIANTRGIPSDDEIDLILKEAYDAGINLIDTSADYGTSEERLGDSMVRIGLSGRFHVVTKIPKVPAGLTDSDIRSFVEKHVSQSLKKLRIERLCSVLYHVESDAVYLPLLNELLEKGLVDMTGVSLDSADHPAEALAAKSVQIPCNLLDRRFQSLIDSDSKRTVFVRSVFLQGLLLMPIERIPSHLSEILPYRRRFEEIADRAGKSLREIAFGYLYSQRNIASIVLGIETIGQLRENLRLIENAILSKDLYDELKNAVGTLPERLIRPMRWNQQPQ